MGSCGTQARQLDSRAAAARGGGGDGGGVSVATVQHCRHTHTHTDAHPSTTHRTQGGGDREAAVIGRHAIERRSG